MTAFVGFTKGMGTTLKHGTASGSETTELLSLTDFSGLGVSCGKIATLNNDVVDGSGVAMPIETYISGIQTPEPVSCEYLYTAANYAALIALIGVNTFWKVTFPDKGGTSASTLQFYGFVDKVDAESKMNEAVKGKFTICVSAVSGTSGFATFTAST